MAPQSVGHFSLSAEQKESEFKAFIDSIVPSNVCSLASRYNCFKPCRIFQDTSNGSYNACFFVEFDGSVRWVVRIPLEPCVHNVWDKVQSEVATTRYLEANTTIPVPHIHAFGRGGYIDETHPTGHAFIIQDYIPGRSLEKSAFRKAPIERRKYFYSQLVDILAQLRQQEFDHAGSLMPDPDGGHAPVVGPSLSIQLNELQLEKCDFSTQPAKFASAIDFAFCQYQFLYQKYKLPAYKMSQEVAQLEVFDLEDLKGKLFGYIDHRWNHGPFVLTHTDPRWSHFIVDDDYRIQGVIDWEWSGTVPRQFFLPPTWFAGLPPDWVSGRQYKIEYRLFFDALKAGTSQPCRQLVKEWGRTLPTRVDLPIAVTLRHHSCFINMYYRGIFPQFHKGSRDDVVKQFFERDGRDGLFTLDVQQQLENSERYTQYLEEHGFVTSSLVEGQESDKISDAINKTSIEAVF